MLAALVAADLVVGRAGSSTLAEVTALGHAVGHRPVPARRRPPGRERARSSPTPGRPGIVADEAFDADALVAAADVLFDEPARGARWRAAARGVRPARRGRRGRGARPGRWPSAGRCRRRGDRRDRPRVTGAAGRAAACSRRAFDADRDRDRDPAPDRGQDVARRAAGAVHDDARRRPGRPVRDRPQHPRAAGDRPVRAVARHAALTLLGRGSDVVIADAGIRGLVVQNRAEGSRVEGDRYIAESGLPMARAATETQAAGLTGLEFGLAIPGTVGGAVWANAGAHDGDVAGVLESADVLLADGTEARADRRRTSASATATAG